MQGEAAWRARSTDTLCNHVESPVGRTTFAVVEVGRLRSNGFTWNCPYKEKVDLSEFLWNQVRWRADDNGSMTFRQEPRN